MPRGTSSLADELAGTVTPTGRMDKSRDSSSKRKQTLLSLLDALSELSKDDAAIAGKLDGSKPNFEDDHDVPTVDERLQVEGAEAFNKFQRRLTNLDKELRNFSNAARQLGSSVGILASAYHLRARLAHLLHLFRCNAADLFPRKVHRQPLEVISNPNLSKKRRRKPPPNVARPHVDEDLDPEEFPDQFRLLAKEVMTFLNCLNEFPEFTDEAVNASIESFESDLKYWADCLSEYKGQFRYPAVQRYLHDLTADVGGLGDHLDMITSTLSYFTEVGVPTIRFGQQHGAANLQNLSTVATFFSAVTATTMQFSYEITGTPVANAVNAFWFASLVFSIASAVNSLLGLTWKQAMYRSPRHRTPWWVLIWIKRSPLVFLVISVASFSIGLVLFAYASGQDNVTRTITTVFTSFSSFGLVAVSAWFASERWAFSRHKGQKWLSDMIDDSNNRILNSALIRWFTKASDVLANSGDRHYKASKELAVRTRDRARSWSLDLVARSRNSVRSGSSTDTLPTTMPTIQSPPGSPPPKEGPSSSISLTGHSKEDSAAIMNTETVPQTVLTGRFASAVRAAMLTLRMPANGHSPAQRRTMSSSRGLGGLDNGPLGSLKASRLAALTPKLKGLEISQDLEAHQALVRHLQFSPDGKYLATSSWDRTSVVFKVGDPFEQWRILAHPQGFVGQVAWSPKGKYLITKLGRGVKIWTEEGVCQKTINRGRTVQSITWLLDGEAFLSVETTEYNSEVVKLDITGKILGTYKFDRMTLHDVAVTPTAERLLAVGTLRESPEGLQPSKSRAEKRIIVYNMVENEIENRVPVLNEVRDITMARDGRVALVSYENKAPPQLWKLDMVKDQNDPSDKNARLTLRHTYMPKVPVDFAGPSYFGGKDDQLVLCAAKSGDIHIWDRESGAILHHIRPQVVGGDLTCIAWNHARDDPFMFATGSHDGAVRIWTTNPNIGGPSPRSSTYSAPVIDIRAASPMPPPSPLYPTSSPVPSPRHTPHQTPTHSPRSLTPAPRTPSPSYTETKTDSPTQENFPRREGSGDQQIFGDTLTEPPNARFKRAVSFVMPNKGAAEPKASPESKANLDTRGSPNPHGLHESL